MNYINSIIATYGCSEEEAEFFLHNNSNKAVLFDNGSVYIPQSWGRPEPARPSIGKRIVSFLESWGSAASHAITL